MAGSSVVEDRFAAVLAAAAALSLLDPHAYRHVDPDAHPDGGADADVGSAPSGGESAAPEEPGQVPRRLPDGRVVPAEVGLAAPGVPDGGWGRYLAGLRPGPELDAALAHLDPADLDDGAVLELVAATERAISGLRARQAAAIVEFTRRGPDGVRCFSTEELAARMRWTAWTASARVSEARTLSTRLPSTLDALACGDLDDPRARIVAAAAAELDEPVALALDEALSVDPTPTDPTDDADGEDGEGLGEDPAGASRPAYGAAVLTTAELRARIAAEVATIDAAAAARRAEAGRRRRRVGVTPLDDGMARLVAEGPAVDVLTMFRGLSHAAEKIRDEQAAAAGEVRGIDAIRFDLLTDWARQLLEDAPPPAPSGQWRPQLLVTCTLAALLGLREDPAYLDGYGPLPAAVVRRIAEDATLRRLLTDPFTGTVIGLDGHTYPGLPPDDSPPDDGPPGDNPPDNGPPDDGPHSGNPSGDSPPDEGAPGEDPPREGAPDGGAPRGGARAVTREGDLSPAAGESFIGKPRERDCAMARSPLGAVGRRWPGAGVAPVHPDPGRYRPRRTIATLIQLRDRTCRAPGCRRRGALCDIDHIVRWPQGPTCPCNLQLLCRRHHRLKHESAAAVWRTATGWTTWRMPTGHVLRRAPEPAIPRVAGHPTDQTLDLCGDPGRLSQYLARVDTAADEFRRLARACGFPVDPDPAPEHDAGQPEHDAGQPEPAAGQPDDDTDQPEPATLSEWVARRVARLKPGESWDFNPEPPRRFTRIDPDPREYTGPPPF
ncbi:DUF222 domain-containing protein [Kineosporiaceae bacterium SCSIO 59966]|nr:DUF222 domain-containing protein [Kineosporiaceae bacterium SCSIO 59966]